MTRYAAFLRGVSPVNLKMPELKLALEAAGFGDVKTSLSSGDVVFSGRHAADVAIERKVEAAIEIHSTLVDLRVPAERGIRSISSPIS